MRLLCTSIFQFYFDTLVLYSGQNNDDMTGHPRSDRGLYPGSRMFTMVEGAKYLGGFCWKFSATANKYASHNIHFYSSKFVFALAPEIFWTALWPLRVLGVRKNMDIGLGYWSVAKYYNIFRLTLAMGEFLFCAWLDIYHTPCTLGYGFTRSITRQCHGGCLIKNAMVHDHFLKNHPR